MNLRYDLVPYSEELRDAYLDLLPEQGKEVGLGKLAWKFNKSPGGRGYVAVARDGPRIVGLNGFMSAAFCVSGQAAVGFQSMDTVVSPSARGKGVFKHLINVFYEHTKGALLYGFPNANSSPAFFGSLGWSQFGPVPMLVRPLKTGFLSRRVAKWLPDFRLPLLARRSPDVRSITRFDDLATQTWRRFSAKIGCSLQRDASFLNWRLADHPTNRYTILCAPDGAFAVFNVAFKHGARVGYLMELIGPEASLPGLAGESLHRMRDAGAEIALAWCLPKSPNYRAYRQGGFYPFPARLRPIELNFGARPTCANDAAITDPDAWYISYLDSDTC